MENPPLTSHIEEFYREVFHNWLFPMGGHKEEEGLQQAAWSKAGQRGEGTRGLETSQMPAVHLDLEHHWVCPLRPLLRSQCSHRQL